MAACLRDRLNDLLNNFQTNPESALKLMNEINILLSSVNYDERLNAVKGLHLTPLFRFVLKIDFQKKEDKDTAVEFLTRVLDSMQAKSVIEQFAPELVLSLQHHSNEIKEMGAKQVKKCVLDNIAISRLIKNTDLMCSMGRLIGEEMFLAKIAMDVFEVIGKDNDAVKVIFSQTVNKVFQDLMFKNDTIRFRVYDVFIRIGCCSPRALDQVVKSGYLKQIINELCQDDILLMLNCVELLTRLTVINHGLECLERENILQKIEQMFDMALKNSMGVFVLPGFLKFFGQLGHANPIKLCVEMPKVLDTIFSLTESNDRVLKSHAVRAIGRIAISSEGKLQLHTKGEKTRNYLITVGKMIKQGTAEEKVDGLATFYDLMQIMSEENIQESEVITESWVRSLMDESLTTLLAYCKCPFPDLKIGAFSVLQVIALQNWGVKELAAFPGFVEYILDRSTEHDKGSKEAKFSVVESLIKCPVTVELFSTEAVSQLNEFYRMGPFYIQTESTVIFEGAS